MKVEGFAVDVDGTITEDWGRLSLEAAFSLRWVEGLGKKVILVSGRSAWEVYTMATFLGTTRVAVGENGGVVATSPVDLALLGDKYEAIRAYDYLCSHVKGIKLRPVVPRLTEVVLERTFEYGIGARLLEESGIGVYLNDSQFAYHITDKRVNKGVGLMMALKVLGLDARNVVGIGDSHNDIPLLKACGYGITLANAPDELKAVANHVASQPYGLGVVEAIRRVVEKLLDGGSARGETR